jgi:hypothetical protein
MRLKGTIMTAKINKKRLIFAGVICVLFVVIWKVSRETAKNSAVSFNTTIKKAPAADVSMSEKSTNHFQIHLTRQSQNIQNRSVSSVPQKKPSQLQTLPSVQKNSWKKEVAPDVLNDLKFVFETERTERAFLLNELGLSLEKYGEIQKHRQVLFLKMKRATGLARANGLNPETLHRELLASHVHWMQDQIGYGNYNRLQEISLGLSM